MISFRTERLSDPLTRIYGVCFEMMYLVEGTERAVLIDTGSGFGSLKAVVNQLTDKPVTVLLTHGHTDHAMGAAEFDDVWMNREDDGIFALHGDKAFRLDGINMSPAKASFNEVEDYIPTADVNSFHDLREGMSFDLGGVTIDVYALPGHTAGSLVLLLREDRILITGDAANSFVFLYDHEALSVDAYEKSLRLCLDKIKGKYDRVLASHGDGELPTDVIEACISCCEDVKNGITDEIPFNFRGSDAWLAKRIEGMGMPPADGSHGNLVYNKNRIYDN